MRRTLWVLTFCGVVGLAFEAGNAQNRYSEDSELDGGRSPFSASVLKRSFNYFSRNRKSPDGDKSRSKPVGSPSFSDDPFSSEPGAQVRPLEKVPQPSIRSGQKLSPPSVSATNQSVPKLKNYYQELFGTPPRSGNSKPLSAAGNPPAVDEQRPQPRENVRRGPVIQKSGFNGQDEAIQPTRSPRLPARQNMNVEKRPQVSQKVSEASPRENPFRVTEKLPQAIQADYDRPLGSSERGQIIPIRANRARVSPFKDPQEIAAGKGPLKSSRNLKAKLDKKNQQTRVGTLRLPAPRLTLPKIKPATKRTVSRSPRTFEEKRPSIAVPNFSQNTPKITLKWNRRSSFNVGQKCVCDLVVKNTSEVAATNIEVAAYFPSSIRLTNVSPEPNEARDYLVWNFPAMAPSEERVIQISMIPAQRGELATTATVRFTGASSTSFDVEEPLLKLTVRGPQKVHLGESASQVVIVSNPGTGVVQNAALEVLVPKGLEHIRGERLYMEIGSLNPGESREVRSVVGRHPWW